MPPNPLSPGLESARGASARLRILVIKLGALGDFVQAMGPAAAIRDHHRDAEITLLTSAPFNDIAQMSPYFDRVWIDERPRGLDISAWLRLRGRLREGHFDRIYDLQTSSRSSGYFHLMRPGRRPEWSGIARGASHPHANPQRDSMHTLDRQADQLAMAGIAAVSPPDLSWAAADIARFNLPPDFMLLVPGGAAHRLDKRWPAQHYAELAALLARHGITPVMIGSRNEAEVTQAVSRGISLARDLAGQTNLAEIVGLGAAARYAVGNDTGPMHLIVAAACPATVLYSSASDPALTQPRGPAVTILRRDALAALGVAEVAATLSFG
ncbi:MAG TPA: glycosyltransferase family 9 protein [Stellaceae bacterium]|nr:glycosyltransferase family 9 protein [Stellaceae bacterium]